MHNWFMNFSLPLQAYVQLNYGLLLIDSNNERNTVSWF